MAVRTEQMVFQGLAGDISCAIDWPDGEPRGWALVLHPHPLQGGARDNKVVTTIARSCVQSGMAAVRPNFRGVGGSAGEFDNAVGETADMLELIRQFREQYPELVAGKWLMGGFSFGTSVAAQVYSTLAQEGRPVPGALVLAGSAVARFRFRDVHVPADTLLLHGEDDDVVPLEEAMVFARAKGLPMVVVPEAGHFFHRKLTIVKQFVLQRLALL